MAGILNSKERIIDFVITQEGKRQAGTGELRIKFASFSDYQTYYETSGSNTNSLLAEDASNRIFFEAGSRFQDVIIPELEPGNSIRPFKTSDFQVQGGYVSSGTFDTGITKHSNVLTGSTLETSVDLLLSDITKNFTDQRIIGTIDDFSSTQNFEAQPSDYKFSIDEKTNYLRSDEIGEANLDNLPSIFSDKRFSSFPNFKYLPPENLKMPGETKGKPLGNYERLNEKEILSFDEIKNDLKDKQKTQITFSKTSRNNNLAIQFFEQNSSLLQKLSIVDYGNVIDHDTNEIKRVCYIGKIERDSYGSDTFICLFTLVIC
jgi:hypothetical protein